MPGPVVVPWWGVLPFAMLLACIATFPLMPWTKRYWHHQSFQLGVALFFGVPMAIWMWVAGNHAGVVHALVEYGQFITLLLSLFVVSGGIFVAGDIEATPRNNAILLGIGAGVASFIGTTGAAMLMIRPLLNVNQQRTRRVHTVVFAIFLVANCGGLLTPLGDPPLFLGMLRGVPFLWTMKLLPEWLFVNGLLLTSYYALDCRHHALEPKEALRRDRTEVQPITIRGKLNFLWLAAIVAGVALVPSVNLEAIHHGHAPWTAWVPFRELVMLAAAVLSLRLGDRAIRYEKNQFDWSPILEVGALFIGIFLAMVPALRYLAQVAPSLPLNAVTLFAFTGGLSAVLDNAPTYVTFFEMARELGGSPAVAGVRELFLTSISTGAVFCGAITYIGNGPNFMVKSIADSANVEMPSFAGYTVRWALPYLVPILVAMALVFIVESWPFKAIGVVLALAIIGHSIRGATQNRRPAAVAATDDP